MSRWGNTDRAEVVRLALLLERGAEIRTRDYARRIGKCQRTIERWLLDVEVVLPLEQVGPDNACSWRRMR